MSSMISVPRYLFCHTHSSHAHKSGPRSSGPAAHTCVMNEGEQAVPAHSVLGSWLVAWP